jgi:NAD(P)-dependent dehydrogenase (short-subunit alcohol dehydrogenase family)
MAIALVIGATRGLGRRVAEQYVTTGATVFGTARKQPEKDKTSESINWIGGIDVSTPTAGETIVKGYKESHPIDVLVVSAGYFGKESFDEPDWEAQERMYKTSAIGPVFLVAALVKAGLLKQGSKVVMVSSEAGSITLRHEKEGGGNYGHHASKAALNMVTKLLSLDLKPRGIPVVAVHPGFMRTEMTKNVGFDQYWESGGGGYNPTNRQRILTIINSRHTGRGSPVAGPLDRQ